MSSKKTTLEAENPTNDEKAPKFRQPHNNPQKPQWDSTRHHSLVDERSLAALADAVLGVEGDLADPDDAAVELLALGRHVALRAARAGAAARAERRARLRPGGPGWRGPAPVLPPRGQV